MSALPHDNTLPELLRMEADESEKLDPTNSSIQVMRDAANLLALEQATVRDLKKELEMEKRSHDGTFHSWKRSLGNNLLNKRHLIDALVMTTERLYNNDAAMLRLRAQMLTDFELATVETTIMGAPVTPIDLQKYIAAIKEVTLP